MLSAAITPARLALLLLAVSLQARPAHSAEVVAGNPIQPQFLTALHRSGQTFLTWLERPEHNGESYRVYRHDQPIDALSLGDAELLYEVWEDSGEFYADRYYRPSLDVWEPRYHERFIIGDLGVELADDTGLFVWTLRPEDFGGQTSGTAYYAVTTVDPLGVENTADFSPNNAIGPLAEQVDDPQPVHTLTLNFGPATAEIYVQYLDLRDWNPTFDAPTANTNWYGESASDPSVANSIQYGYTYAVFPPYAGCATAGQKAVMVSLHAFGGFKKRPLSEDPDPELCDIYRIYPVDVSDTWWFGFARDVDFRQSTTIGPGEVIENFTEQRTLRMVRDLLDHPTYGSDIDPQRVYLSGVSMGGSGTLAMALRYPTVFAAAYADLAMSNFATSGDGGGTDWRDNVELKWGEVLDDNPVEIDSFNGEADHLAAHSGTGTWTWQNHQQQILARRAEDMVPFGLGHGLQDTVIEWTTQGAPFYLPLNGSDQVWSATVKDQEHVGTNFEGLPLPLTPVGSALFSGWSAIRDETVPGLTNASLAPPLPPISAAEYNLDMEWSPSWNAWDQPPTDTPEEWGVTLRTVDGSIQTVDVTPRRLQTFEVVPGTGYSFVNEALPALAVVGTGTVMADADGIVTVPGFLVGTVGNRLRLKPLLTADVTEISEAVGGSQTMTIDAGKDLAGDLYWVLGSASGTSPGFPAPPYVLPVNVDPWFSFTLSAPNTPVLAGSFSTLDLNGDATTVLTLPAGLGPNLVGITLFHACMVFEISGVVNAVSSAVSVTVVP